MVDLAALEVVPGTCVNQLFLTAEGLASFNKATLELLLGADSPAIKEKRVAVLQARRAPSLLPGDLSSFAWLTELSS